MAGIFVWDADFAPHQCLIARFDPLWCLINEA